MRWPYRARLRAGLRSGVDPADAALVAVIAAAGLTLVLDRRTARAQGRRIQELAELSGPAVPALRAWIRAAANGEV